MEIIIDSEGVQMIIVNILAFRVRRGAGGERGLGTGGRLGAVCRTGVRGAWLPLRRRAALFLLRYCNNVPMP